ncbi:uncharacterized protein BXZ73DRAFT_92540 [Epithele typhae]|uniref:uncharacterized protein n=1 Tax=Epithele typhae TaxID=378194 RepID=UPI002007E60F|nr:uncharacterized protein BXZ73DRAFT_92540 [Epithele typhae]KAH9915921.1 hypothetical protein BXZ73DRAFT_92540 [Epithele typhae]
MDPCPALSGPSPASFVRALWFGPLSSSQPNDLDYDSPAWPITLIHQILACTINLTSLAVVLLGQRTWHRLAGIDYPHLSCAPALRTVTSLDTFMVDAEVRALVHAPSTVRAVRRVYSNVSPAELAFAQLACVDDAAPALERFEIVCYAATATGARASLDAIAEGWEFDRERVVLVGKEQVVDSDGRTNSVAAFHADWLGYVPL